MTYEDSDPTSLRVQGDVLRRLTGRERFSAACEMTLFAQRLTRAGLRDRWPQASEEQLDEAHFELVFGPELAHSILECRRRRRSSGSADD